MNQIEFIEKWETLKIEGFYQEYFNKKSIHTIAIYGVNEAAIRVIDDLKNDGVNITYVIAADKETYKTDINVVSIESELMPVDVIFVIDFEQYEIIEKEICERYDYTVASGEMLLRQLRKYANAKRMNKIKQFCKEHPNVYLYGAGEIGKKCLVAIKKLEIHPQGFVVSQCKMDEFVLDVPVIGFEQFCRVEHTGVIITVGKKNYDEVVEQELQ